MDIILKFGVYFLTGLVGAAISYGALKATVSTNEKQRKIDLANWDKQRREDLAVIHKRIDKANSNISLLSSAIIDIKVLLTEVHTIVKNR